MEETVEGEGGVGAGGERQSGILDQNSFYSFSILIWLVSRDFFHSLLVLKRF